MKILQVNCVYNKGSTGKIVYDISKGLEKRNIESVVCYGRGAKVSEKGVYKVSSEFEAKVHSLLGGLFGVRFGFSFFATNKTISIIKKRADWHVFLFYFSSSQWKGSKLASLSFHDGLRMA